jgi:ribonuclease R
MKSGSTANRSILWALAREAHPLSARNATPKASAGGNRAPAAGFLSSAPANMLDGARRRTSLALPVRRRFPTRQSVADFIRDFDGAPTRRDIAKAFGVRGDDRARLRRMLSELEEEGGAAGAAGKKVRLADALPPVLPIDVMSVEDDDLLCLPAGWEGETEPPMIRIAAAEARRAKPAPGIGDRLLARLTPAGDAGYEAKIIRPIGRGAHRFLAVFRQTKSGGIAEPVERRARNSFSVERAEAKGAKEGDLVWIEAEPRVRGGRGRARVRAIAGHVEDKNAYSLIALAAHDVPVELPEEAIAAAERAHPPSLAGRVDLRALPFVTIDPEDAKDHDDAVFAEPDPDPANPGGWRILVAIADVSWFVRSGSPLDREALRRGNSVYLPDRVVPMLPERLSNDLCSLRADEDRPCLVADIVIDCNGRKRRQRFLRAMMRSHARLSYAEAQQIIGDETVEGPAADAVRRLYAAFRTRWRERSKRAPLDLDLPERKIILDEDGAVARIVKRARYDAHRLIEEFMILANVAAAETLEQRKTPQIYRVHDAPDPEKLDSARAYLEELDYSLAKGAVRPSQLNQILKIAEERGQQEMISDVILRAQKQAVYAADNLGHFGLNLARYSHFTSPIRRYADLVIHRALVAALRLGEGGQTADEAKRLPKIAEHISDMERRAIAVEREAADRYLAAYLEDRLGEEFDARIRGVTRFGVFVMLDETGGDGFVPIRAIGGERFEFVEDKHALVGAATGGVFRLGQAVKVRLVEAAPLRGGLTFEMISDPVEDPNFIAARKIVRRKTTRRKGKPPRDGVRRRRARR